VTQQFARALYVGRADDGNAKRYRFRASTTGAARDGMVIPSGEWRIDNYLKNPVVLLSHDYWSMPIGRTVEITPDAEGLLATIEYDAGDPRAVDVMRKLERVFMHAVSVGFRPGRTEWPSQQNQVGMFHDVELLEISNVAVPSDPNALLMHGYPTDTDTRLAAIVQRLEALEQQFAVSAPDPVRDVTADGAAIDLDRYPTLKELSHAR